MPSFTVFKGTTEGAITQTTTTKPDLTSNYVLVKVTASGLCGTAGIVLGHEGAAVVEDIGPDVKSLKKGDRVGWGYETDACGQCKQCLEGFETFCPDRVMYGMPASADQGSFASHAVWRETFLHRLPDGLSDEDAAPLQCGGATVYTVLQDAKASETVGVMGVGGLGHLAIQFAAKQGCHVVVLSGSESKKDEAIRLGAHKFVAMGGKNADQVKEAMDGWQIDRLAVCTSAQPDWDAILPVMAPRSTIFPLSVSSDKLSIPYMPLLAGGIAIQGSIVATRAVHREMLEFAAFHKVAPVIEKFPMTTQGIEDAMDRLDKGKVHFRAVLIPQ